MTADSAKLTNFNWNGVDFYGVQISAKSAPFLLKHIGRISENPLSLVEYFSGVILFLQLQTLVSSVTIDRFGYYFNSHLLI